MTTHAWSSALDDFERTLAEQRLALAAGLPEQAPTFTPPSDLGPLPPSMQARATTLLFEATRLNEQLSAAVASTQRELTMLGRMRPAELSGASYIDSSL